MSGAPARPVFLIATSALLVSARAAMPQGAETAAPAGAHVGRELREMEEALRAPTGPVRPAAPPPVAADFPSSGPDRAVVVGAASNMTVGGLTLRGDIDEFERAGLRREIETLLMGRTLSEPDIRAAAARCQERLVKMGYFLATVEVVAVDWANGAVALRVVMGRFGRMSFYETRGQPGGVRTRAPFSGRYFGEAQLRRALSDLTEGSVFNYDAFYEAVFRLNAHPDLTLHSKIRRRDEAAGGAQGRFGDIEFTVEERLPLHFIGEVSNTGTEATEKWRLGLTAQHLNLSRRDDVLTFKVLASPDFASMRSVAASYAVPRLLVCSLDWTLYAGYARTDASDYLPQIAMKGSGGFAGLQCARRLPAAAGHLLSAGAGAVYRRVEDYVVLQGVAGEKRSAEVLPIALTLNYSSAEPDATGGRNFVTSETAFNAGAWLGVTGSGELERQRQHAGRRYLVERLQAARLQPLLGWRDASGARRGQWIVLVKFTGQAANTSLIPAEQFALGGASSARGYLEREVLGDSGVCGTVELRTPMISNLVGGMLAGPFAAGFADRMQVVVFGDGGSVRLKESPDTASRGESLRSVGLGLRWSFAECGQVRMDFAYRLAATADSDRGWGSHVSAQFEF